MTVIFALRIEQHVSGLAQSKKLIKYRFPNDRDVSVYAYMVDPFSATNSNLTSFRRSM